MADWWVESFADVLIAVPPQFAVTPGDLTFGADTVISVPPDLVMAGAGASLADVLVSVPPAMAIGLPAAAAVTVNLAPTLAFGAVAHMGRDVTISVPPTVGVAGAGNSAAAVTVSVPPAVAYSGSGADGVSTVTLGAVASMSTDAYSTSGSFSITTAAGDYVIVDVVSSTSGAPTAVTHDGNAMTLLTTKQVGTQDTYLRRYGISGAGAGAKTVSITYASNVWLYAAGASVSGVTSVSTATASGTGSPSQGETCSAGELILHAFGGYAGTWGTATGPTRARSYDGTWLRYRLASATASATFGDTGTGLAWAGIATVLKPT